MRRPSIPFFVFGTLAVIFLFVVMSVIISVMLKLALFIVLVALAFYLYAKAKQQISRVRHRTTFRDRKF